jgi:hypothetical protein
MAIMIPNDVEEFGTDGERVFFNFLRSVAKPDSRYVAWYLPDINKIENGTLFKIIKEIFEINQWRPLFIVVPRKLGDHA